MIVRPKIEQYAQEHTSREPSALTELAEETRRISSCAHMMVGALEGRLLALLVHLLQPRLVLEIGTFTGYSTLAMAEALPANGRIITCENSPAHACVARRHIGASRWADQIDVYVGPALETIRALHGPFDLVFIDADKPNYANYYDAVLPKLSERGIIAADNVLWMGRVIAEDDRSEETGAIRAFNAKVRDDPRVEQVLLTVREGLTLIRKVSQFTATEGAVPRSSLP